MSIKENLLGLLGFFRRTERSVPQYSSDPITHVILLDGTMSSLDEGCETNVGLIYKALSEVANDQKLSIMYEAGIQWSDWSTTLNVIEGRGINRQIRRAYGYLASRYRPGDRVFLLGYSRGAYAVRSLAGVIDRVGLLKAEHATVSNIRTAYRHYQLASDPDTGRIFAETYCHPKTPIEMVGVFDTVKALGLRAPFVWRWAEVKHSFHSHELGPSILHGFHALALNETREAFAPVMWEATPDQLSHVEQVWFRGTHGDVGGQLSGYQPARPLANIPLVWMLENLEQCALQLPAGWRTQFPRDENAPSVGTFRGWGKIFLARSRRQFGSDLSETIHSSAAKHVSVK